MCNNIGKKRRTEWRWQFLTARPIDKRLRKRTDTLFRFRRACARAALTAKDHLSFNLCANILSFFFTATRARGIIRLGFESSWPIRSPNTTRVFLVYATTRSLIFPHIRRRMAVRTVASYVGEGPKED